MTADSLQLASGFVDAFDKVLGFPIEESSLEECGNLSDEECLELADLLDRTMTSEKSFVKTLENPVIAMAYENWRSPEEAIQPRLPKLALLHERILMPIGDIRRQIWDRHSRRRGAVSRTDVENLHEWTRANSQLIRAGAVVPCSHDIYLTEALSELCYESAISLEEPATGFRAHRVAPVGKDLCREEAADAFRSSVESFLEMMFCVKKFGAIPVLTDRIAHALWHELKKQSISAQLNLKRQCQASETFVSFDFPCLASLSHEDIVKLRTDSKGFDLWRGKLHSVMRATRAQIKDGVDPKTALERESWPLKESARSIEKELGKKSFSRQIHRTGAQCVIGASTLLAASPLFVECFGADPVSLQSLAKTLPGALASLFLWFLFDRGPSKDDIQLRFYSAMLNQSSD